ncbi:toxin-antitoxin system YwqK family antitoxin [Mucilaginibacter antarcticus]|uniref:Toxin-antitoxin system YwqK family antitoxin n=1 Tax=Mucilaginibacter antarcticus TaxID=1855725 RepID=A0ABW5XM48_9SPHI
MKLLLALPLAVILYSSTTQAQNAPRRSVHFDFINKDSINLSLNKDFDLIEDSCSLVKRYAHIDMRIHKFVGKVKDVSRVDPNVIVTEGNYNTEGQKDGPFITHYLNGQLQAKGNFKKDKYDGKWELFYDDGRPKLTFEASDNGIIITDTWDEKGKQLVEGGKGVYSSSGSLFWKGKLLNGKPDGTWTAQYASDKSRELASEKFTAGVFTKGKSPVGEYTDASRLELVPNTLLQFVRAEALKVSAVGCNPVTKTGTRGVEYKHGIPAYSNALVEAVAAYMYYIDVAHFTNKFTIEGEINEAGYITNMNCQDSFNQQISGGLINCLKQAPALEPATINGKPAKQKVSFVFTFAQGAYRFNYRFGSVFEKK